MKPEPSELSSRQECLHQVIADYLTAVQQGQDPDRAKLLRRHPDLAQELEAFFADHDRVKRLARPFAAAPASPGEAAATANLDRRPDRTADFTPGPAATMGPGQGQPAAPSPGTRVRYVGDYELLEELGRGGMGVVYKARQNKLNRLVALKMILAGEHAGPQDLARFRSEAQAVARLQHAHIVQIYEVGEYQGHPYFSLEFCPGGSLDKKLDGIPWPADRAAALVETLARAMQAAHQAGVVHRDLKPANVLLGADGTVKITDFGLAKQLEAEPGVSTSGGLTASGAILGTPSYMAPEQAAGKTREVGPAADVYALGAILYELLTGRPPFRAATPLDTLLQVVHEDPVSPWVLQPQLPRDLETICLKCLHKDPPRRYPSALELAEDLHRFLAGEPIRARPISPWERMGKWARRRPALAALAVVSVAAVLSLVLGGWWSNARLQAERDHALVQERIAQQHEAEAEQQRQVAEQQRARAEERELAARRYLYAAQMKLAQRAWEQGQVGRVQELLEDQRPEPGQADLRGFEWYYLWRLCHGERWSLSGRQDLGLEEIKGNPSLFLAPDARTAARVQGQDVEVWDLTTTQKRFILGNPPGGIQVLAFAADGGALVLGGKDGSVSVWDVATGKPRAGLKRLPAGSVRVALSPDGRVLASRGPDMQVRLYDATTGQERLALPGRYPNLGRLVFSPDGKLLAGTEPSRVWLWDPATGAEHSLVPEAGPAHTPIFSPDGKRLLVLTENNPGASLWETATARQVRTFPGIEGGWVACGAFSPDGRMLALGVAHPFDLPRTGAVLLQDALTFRPLARWEVPAGGAWQVAFAPDSRVLAIGGNNGVITLRDLPAGQVRAVLYGQTRRIADLAFAPDGRTLASRSLFDGMLKVWDTAPRQDPLLLKGHLEVVSSVAISPDNQVLVSGRADGTIQVWDLATGRERAALPVARGGDYKVAFSPDGRTLAVGDNRKLVTLWDVATWKPIARIAGHRGSISSVRFSPDSRFLVSGAGPGIYGDTFGEVKRWDLAGRKEQASWSFPTTVWGVAVSPDSRLLAAACMNTVRVWEADGGKERFRWTVTEAKFMAVAFSPDGRTVAAGGWDGMTRLWDLATGQERATLKGHTQYILALAFSPDGRILATGSGDTTIKLWDAATGQERFTLRGPFSEVRCLAFGPDGRTLAAGLGDGTVELWQAAAEPEPGRSVAGPGADNKGPQNAAGAP